MIKQLDLTKPGAKPVVNGLPLTVFHANNQKERPLGAPKAIVMHWTAGNYTQLWDDYHFNIAYDQRTGEAIVVKMLQWDQLGMHLWGRNTGMVGITFCAMDGASPPSSPTAKPRFGAHPVTQAQVEAAAKLVAEICAWKHLEPAGSVTLDGKRRAGNVLVSTGKTIQAPVIGDHAFYARKDGYASDRWDIERFMVDVYKRANEEYHQLKAGTDQFMFKSLLVD